MRIVAAGVHRAGVAARRRAAPSPPASAARPCRRAAARCGRCRRPRRARRAGSRRSRWSSALSRISSGSPASAAFAFSVVRGQCSPTSGSAWIARRSATTSSSPASPIAAQSVAVSRSRVMARSFASRHLTPAAAGRPARRARSCPISPPPRRRRAARGAEHLLADLVRDLPPDRRARRRGSPRSPSWSRASSPPRARPARCAAASALRLRGLRAARLPWRPARPPWPAAAAAFSASVGRLRLGRGRGGLGRLGGEQLLRRLAVDQRRRICRRSRRSRSAPCARRRHRPDAAARRRDQRALDRRGRAVGLEQRHQRLADLQLGDRGRDVDPGVGAERLGRRPHRRWSRGVKARSACWTRLPSCPATLSGMSIGFCVMK